MVQKKINRIFTVLMTFLMIFSSLQFETAFASGLDQKAKLNVVPIEEFKKTKKLEAGNNTSVVVVDETQHEYYQAEEVVDCNENTWCFKITNDTQPIRVRYTEGVVVGGVPYDVEITFDDFVVFDGTEIVPDNYVSQKSGWANNNVSVTDSVRPHMTVVKNGVAFGNEGLSGNWFINIKQVRETFTFYKAGTNFTERQDVPQVFFGWQQLQRGEKVIFLNNDRMNVYSFHTDNHAIRRTDVASLKHPDWGTGGKMYAYDSFLENDDKFNVLEEKDNAKRWQDLPTEITGGVGLLDAFSIGTLMSGNDFTYLFDFQEDSNIDEYGAASSYQFPGGYVPVVNVYPKNPQKSINKTEAKIGDEIEYIVSYQMDDLKDAALEFGPEYSLQLIDNVDNRLKVLGAWLEGGTPGDDISNAIGKFIASGDDNKVHYSFNDSHMALRQVYDGTVYKLHIRAKVVSGNPGDVIPNTAERYGGFHSNTVNLTIIDDKGTAQVVFKDKSQNNKVLKTRDKISGTPDLYIHDDGYTIDLNNYLHQGYRLVSDGTKVPTKFVTGQNILLDVILESPQKAVTVFVDSISGEELSRRAGVSGFAGENIIDEGYKTDETNSIKYYQDNGYTLVSDEYTSNPKYDNEYGNTQEVVIKLRGKVGIAEIQKLDCNNTPVSGASLSILDADGNIVHSWISSNEPHIVDALKPNTEYTLRETKIDGNEFAISKDVKFKTNSEESAVKVNIYGSRHAYGIKDLDGRYIPGYKIEVIDGATGSVVDSWISDSHEHVIKNLEASKTYRITVKEVPAGYLKVADSIINPSDSSSCEVPDPKDETAYSKRIVVEKIDNDGHVIYGAKMQVLDEDGNVIDAWTVDSDKHDVSGLEMGETYTLHQEYTPDGYITVEDIVFTVDPDTSKNQTITMIDPRLIVEKVDNNGKHVVNAELSALVENDAVDSWNSGREIIEFTNEELDAINEGEVVTRENGTRLFALNDTEISVMTINGSKVSYYIVDHKGLETKHLVSGVQLGDTVLIQEDKAPAGYYTANSVSVALTDTKDKHVKLVDNEIDYTFVKKDAATGLPVAKAKYSVFEIVQGTEESISGKSVAELKSSGAIRVITDFVSVSDANGQRLDTQNRRIASQFKAGQVYYVQEIEAPLGYKLDTTVHKIVVDSKGSGTRTVELKDYPAEFKVLIKKFDTDKTNKLQGAEFTIYNNDNKVVKQANGKDAIGVTNANGEVEFVLSYNANSKFYTMETKAPNGYFKSDKKFAIAVPQDYSFVNSNPITIEVTNDKIPSVQKKVLNSSNQDINNKEVSVGDEITYVISFENPFKEIKEVTIIDSLPEGTQFVSASDGGKFENNKVTWTRALTAQAKVEVSFKVKVIDSAAKAKQIKNKAEIKFEGHDFMTNEVVNPVKVSSNVPVNTGFGQNTVFMSIILGLSLISLISVIYYKKKVKEEA